MHSFMHLDILAVGSVRKVFDVVVSSGVIHHLRHPSDGVAGRWKSTGLYFYFERAYHSSISSGVGTQPTSRNLKHSIILQSATVIMEIILCVERLLLFCCTCSDACGINFVREEAKRRGWTGNSVVFNSLLLNTNTNRHRR